MVGDRIDSFDADFDVVAVVVGDGDCAVVDRGENVQGKYIELRIDVLYGVDRCNLNTR